MVSMYQKTVKNIIEFSGIGLHTGIEVKIRIVPSEKDSGISFIRKDLPGSPSIKVSAENVVATSYATTLGQNGATVSTVEHLLAAFYGMGIDNAVIEVFGPEIPIMDGSADAFVKMLDETGVERLNAPKKYIFIKKPIKVVEKDKFIYLEPSKDLRFTIDYTIDFSHPSLNRQSMVFSLSMDLFKKEVTRARTFGFLKEIKTLKEHGLAKGGSLENAVVIGDDEILNKDGLRFSDEFVRHKILDLIGDISLVGMPIIGRVSAFRSGHSLNQALVKKILEEKECWRKFEFVDEESLQESFLRT